MAIHPEGLLFERSCLWEGGGVVLLPQVIISFTECFVSFLHLFKYSNF